MGLSFFIFQRDECGGILGMGVPHERVREMWGGRLSIFGSIPGPGFVLE
jgi:hypothetical protein